jgi:hypothetical protein
MVVAAGKGLLRSNRHDGRRSGKQREGYQDEAESFSHVAPSFEDGRSLARAE